MIKAPENMYVLTHAQVRKKIKTTAIVTAILTAILVAVLTFFITLGLPASTKSISFSLPLPDAPTATNEYAQRVIQTRDVIRMLYNIPEARAEEYSYLIHSFAYPGDFPTAEDIVAIIGIESRFDEDARSGSDARGLMQVLKGHYRVDQNISDGTQILTDYYHNLKNDKQAAVQAFNVGIGAYLSGKRVPDYYASYTKELAKVKKAQESNFVASVTWKPNSSMRTE